MASQEGSRKRIKISRTQSREAPISIPGSSSSAAPPSSASRKHAHPDDLTAGMEGNSSSNGIANSNDNDQTDTNTTTPAEPSSSSRCCTHEQTLKTLTTDLDAMRQLVTCKICDRFLYEPFSLVCGHTYCYSCLTQWLVSNSKKTCPDCRRRVSVPPTPSYVIREMVIVFIARTELLPDGETAEEHAKLAREEAETLAKDRDNSDPTSGGLFRGCFKHHGRRRLHALRDTSDNVDRCPACLFELEHGYCNQCGERVEGGEDDDSDDLDLTYGDSNESDLDHELDLEDAEAVFGVDGEEHAFALDGDWAQGPRGGLNAEIADYLTGGALRRTGFSPVTLSDDEEEDDDDDDGSDLADFVVDDEEPNEYESDASSDHTELQNQPSQRRRRRHAAVTISSDDDDEQEPQADVRVTVSYNYGASSGSEPYDDEDDEEDLGPIPLAARASRRAPYMPPVRQRRMIVDSDDEDEDESESDDGSPGHGGPPGYRDHPVFLAGSPRDVGSSVYDEDDDDEDGSVRAFGHHHFYDENEDGGSHDDDDEDDTSQTVYDEDEDEHDEEDEENESRSGYPSSAYDD